MLTRLLLIAQTVVTKHQVVMRLQILRIDRQNGLQNLHSI